MHYFALFCTLNLFKLLILRYLNWPVTPEVASSSLVGPANKVKGLVMMANPFFIYSTAAQKGLDTSAPFIIVSPV